jgi:Flp pilus assembly protein TadG
MVTAEMAAVLPVLALVTAVALWGIGAVASQVRCGDAAREAARAAARGEPSAQVRLAATRAAPPGALVTVSAGSAGTLRVRVTARVGPLGRWLPAITVIGDAVAEREIQVGR